MSRRILTDTGGMVRYALRTDPSHEAVRALVKSLVEQGDELCYAPQGVREALNIPTRPTESRGFGRTYEQAERAIQTVEAAFILLPDTLQVYEHWRWLVAKYRITGKSVHDANVVATALAHGATHILTLNERDFRRYAEVATVTP